MVACFYTVEQCSAINYLSIASALQLSKSGLCNLKRVMSGGTQKVLLSQLNAFATSYAFQAQCFAMTALLQTSQKAFLESVG